MSEEEVKTEQESPPSPLKEMIQPFVDVVRAPRALWGINLPYLLEGMAYFGFLGYLAIYFSDTVFAKVPNHDIYSHYMVMVLTAGITIAMFFLGFVADKHGVRFALIAAFLLLFVGRVLISIGPALGLKAGWMGGLHLITMAGILLVVIGYGMFQPAAYAAVRKFTNKETAAMGFAMLYALMNLGGYLPSFAFLLRDKKFLGWGIPGVFWVYTSVTFLALVLTYLILSKKVVSEAIAKAKAERAVEKTEEKNEDGISPENTYQERTRVPVHMWILLALMVGSFAFISAAWLRDGLLVLSALTVLVFMVLPKTPQKKVLIWVANHPLSDVKFFFFIFALIPVQTLFTYNWFILPQYVERCYASLKPLNLFFFSIPQDWIGRYFEIASNLNPLLVFVAVPIITAITYRRKVYNMMIAGTFVMAAPAFLLGMGTNAVLLFSFLFIMTIGEAMWQPRFLQYAAEIAPEGKTGVYMGVAQFPWFLTKMLVPLYSGTMMEKFCPSVGARDPQKMWLIFGCIAIASSIALLLAKGWVGKDFKTKA